MRIFAASFQCESNTFCKRNAGYDDFEILRGTDAAEKLAASQVFKDAGCEMIPGIFASALPAGCVEQDAFKRIADEIMQCLEGQETIDGIYLYLHGSMYVSGLGSGEEALLKRIREKMGNQIPIAVALDFHANNTPAFVGRVNIVQGFRTAPHTDHDLTEIRATQGLIRCIKQGVLPKPVMIKVPVLAADAAVTAKPPLFEIMQQLGEMEKDSDIFSAAFFNGQPWADFEYVGPSVIVMHNQNHEKALGKAEQLAQMFWDGKDKMKLGDQAMLIPDALAYAKKADSKPVFLCDSGDNTTAGAEGEGTLMLDAVMKSDLENVLICAVTSKDIIDRYQNSAVGQEISFRLGEKHDAPNMVAVNVSGTIKCFGDVTGWSGEKAGRSMTVSTGAIDIVITDVRAAYISKQHFDSAGVHAEEYDTIVLKMGYLFPKLHDISDNDIFVLTPGASTNLFESIAYKRIVHPVYPLDAQFEWRPEPLATE